MIQITTESGAVYEWEPGVERVRRIEGPEVHGEIHRDGDWFNAVPVNGVEVGQPVMWTDGRMIRRTTPVVAKWEV